jgi:hypothetical protein
LTRKAVNKQNKSRERNTLRLSLFEKIYFLVREMYAHPKENLLAMKIYILTFTIMLAFSAIGFSQTDLPIIGSISDIDGLSKVYLVADNESRKPILKQFGKQKVLSIVEKPDDAEFFIEYKTLSRQPFTSGGTTETGQIDVFIYREKKKVIAWSESTTGGGFKGDTANSLIKKFLKVLQKK